MYVDGIKEGSVDIMHSGVRVISRHYVHTRGGDRLTMEARGPASTAITANNRPSNVSKFDSSRSCYSLLRRRIRIDPIPPASFKASVDILSTTQIVNLSSLSNNSLDEGQGKHALEKSPPFFSLPFSSLFTNFRKR